MIRYHTMYRYRKRYIDISICRVITTPLRTDWHHTETAASSEQCSSDCLPGYEAMPREAVIAPAALAGGPATDYVQAGGPDRRTRFYRPL